LVTAELAFDALSDNVSREILGSVSAAGGATSDINELEAGMSDSIRASSSDVARIEKPESDRLIDPPFPNLRTSSLRRAPASENCEWVSKTTSTCLLPAAALF